jgi:hypothetical protein
MVHKMYGPRLEKGSMTMKCTQVEDLCLANSLMFGLPEFTMGYLFERARTCLQAFRSWNLEKISKHCKLGLTKESVNYQLKSIKSLIYFKKEKKKNEFEKETVM